MLSIQFTHMRVTVFVKHVLMHLLMKSFVIDLNVCNVNGEMNEDMVK